MHQNGDMKVPPIFGSKKNSQEKNECNTHSIKRHKCKADDSLPYKSHLLFAVDTGHGYIQVNGLDINMKKQMVP